jgi:hypothetical protein
MMMKEDYFTGSARSRIIRWLRVQDRANSQACIWVVRQILYAFLSYCLLGRPLSYPVS